MDYEPRHRAEPKHVTFEPGDRLRGVIDSHHVHGRQRFTDHVFLVLNGGYTVEGQWHIFVTPTPLTSKHFVKIGDR